MKIIDKENLRMWDIDDTLVMHNPYGPSTAEKFRAFGAIAVVDPLNVNNKIIVYKNEPMIRLMQEEYARGSTNIVWSRGGYEWAKNVIEALGLTELVHTVMSKPLVYMDDKPVEEWMKDRVYIGPTTPYKRG